jgi:hypothetical protein
VKANVLKSGDSVEGAVLADQVKSLGRQVRDAKIHSKAPTEVLKKVRAYGAVLLGLRS